MKRIVALVGVRGAGKSTLLAALDRHPNIDVLTPTTNRPKREGVEEYEFVDDFPHGNAMAWKIQVGEHFYGVRKDRVNAIPDGLCGITVFDPGSLEALENFRRTWSGEVVTIGLDTISTLSEQHARVSENESRKMSTEEFESQLEKVKKTDIVLRGNQATIQNAAKAVCELLVSRGGLIGKNWLVPLVEAGTLLDNAQVDGVQPASYDLRLGSEVWCQGKRHDLTEQEPFFKIPPYSYAIVKAEESARIPCFMAGRFDLTVSLFFKGVLLSNGPQVDPGYEGALFCTLFNGRDAHAELKRGAHFATIEFCTLGNRVNGYVGPYQRKERLNDFLLAETGTGPGGDIIGRIDKLEEKLDTVRTNTAKYWWTMVGLFAAVLTIAISVETYLLSSLKNDVENRLELIVSDAEEDTKKKLEELLQIESETRKRLSDEAARIEKMKSEIDGKYKRIELLEIDLKKAEKRTPRPSNDGNSVTPSTATPKPKN